MSHDTYPGEVGYSVSDGTCVYIGADDRKIIAEQSGHSPIMRETPHLVHGEEIRTGGLSFIYLDNEDPVPDAYWPSADEFRYAVDQFGKCLRDHMTDDGEHRYMGPRRVRTGEDVKKYYGDH